MDEKPPPATDGKETAASVLWDYLIEPGITTDKDVLRARLETKNAQFLLETAGATKEEFLFQAHATMMSQDIYNHAGFKVETPILVPLAPKLTPKQRESLEEFSFLPIYIPAITEDEYPESFVKPAWGKSLIVRIYRKPFVGQWVAIETIAKPDWDDERGYVDDRLMAAIKKGRRSNTSWNELYDRKLLECIAEATNFPKKETCLPTAEEWNFAANCFNWLRENCSVPLPDLGSTESREWCENACDSGSRRLVVGGSRFGGLAHVGSDWRDASDFNLALRVLMIL